MMDDHGYPIYASAYDFAYGADVFELGYERNFTGTPVRTFCQPTVCADKVDGVVYVSTDPSFFQIYPPFSFRQPFTEFIKAKKFKGLSEWHKEKDKLYEVKLANPRDYIFSLIVAMESRVRFDFTRFHEIIMNSLRAAIRKSNSESHSALDRSTSDDTPTLMTVEDWHKLGQHWMPELKSFVAAHNIFRDVDADLTFVLYHFGDNIDVSKFNTYNKDWISPSKLDFFILHIARDISVHRHVMFFRPENICLKVKQAIRNTPSLQIAGPYVFRAGLQAGYGNVRVAISNPIPSVRSGNSNDLPKQSIRSLTWYSRLNQEMHRDKFFGSFNFMKFLAEVYEQLFFKETRVSNTAKMEKQLWELASGKVSEKLVGASKLLQSQYSGRIEAVQCKTPRDELRDKKMSEIVNFLVDDTKTWIQNSSLSSGQVMHAKAIAEVEAELSHWLPHFAGTLHLTFKKMFSLYERNSGKIPHILSPTIEAKDILLYEDVVAVQAGIYLLKAVKPFLSAVGYLIDGYLSGRFFCNSLWREYLNISKRELKTDITRENTYHYKFRFKNLQTKTESYDFNSEKKSFKTIKLSMSEFTEGLLQTRPKIFLAEIPRFYAEFLQNKSAFLCAKKCPQGMQRDIALAYSMDAADSLVKLFISSVLFHSKLDLKEALTLEMLYDSIEFASAQHIITTDELVSVIYGERSEGRVDLENCCSFIKTVINYNKSVLPGNFKAQMISCFNSFIIEEGYPIVIPRMEGNTTKSVRVVVPQFFDQRFLECFNEEERLRKIDNFNKAWGRAAFKTTYFRDIHFDGSYAAYECFSSMTVLELKRLNVPQIAKTIASCIRFHQFRRSSSSLRQNALIDLESITNVSDDLKMKFLCGKVEHGQFKLIQGLLSEAEIFSLEQGYQNHQSAQPTGAILFDHQIPLDDLNMLEVPCNNQIKYSIRAVDSGRFKKQYQRRSKTGNTQASTSVCPDLNGTLQLDSSRRASGQGQSAVLASGSSEVQPTSEPRKRIGARLELYQQTTPKLPRPACVTSMVERLRQCHPESHKDTSKSTARPNTDDEANEQDEHEEQLNSFLDLIDSETNLIPTNQIAAENLVPSNLPFVYSLVQCKVQLNDIFKPIMPEITFVKNSKANRDKVLEHLNTIVRHYSYLTNEHEVHGIGNYWETLARILELKLELLLKIHKRWKKRATNKQT